MKTRLTDWQVGAKKAADAATHVDCELLYEDGSRCIFTDPARPGSRLVMSWNFTMTWEVEKMNANRRKVEKWLAEGKVHLDANHKVCFR